MRTEDERAEELWHCVNCGVIVNYGEMLCEECKRESKDEDITLDLLEGAGYA